MLEKSLCCFPWGRLRLPSASNRTPAGDGACAADVSRQKIRSGHISDRRTSRFFKYDSLSRGIAISGRRRPRSPQAKIRSGRISGREMPEKRRGVARGKVVPAAWRVRPSVPDPRNVLDALSHQRLRDPPRRLDAPPSCGRSKHSNRQTLRSGDNRSPEPRADGLPWWSVRRDSGHRAHGMNAARWANPTQCSEVCAARFPRRNLCARLPMLFR
jgi:hypothetical protein